MIASALTAKRAKTFRLGMTGLAMLLLTLAGAAARLPFAGATILPAQISLTSSHVILAHPEGGRVTEVRVAPGQAVEKGQVLFRLDDRDLVQHVANLDRQVLTLEVAQARIGAQANAEPFLRFPLDLQAKASKLGLATLLKDEADLFAAEAADAEGRLSRIQAERDEAEAALAAIEARIDALQSEQRIVESERAARAQLSARGLAPASTARAGERDAARILGDLREARANAEAAARRIAMLDATRISETAARRAEKIDRLLGLERDILGLMAERNRIAHRLADLTIAAPQSGTVLDVAATPGRTLRPGEPALSMVPSDAAPIVEIELPPDLRYELSEGMVLTLRMSDPASRPQRREVDVRITNVAPDATSTPDGRAVIRVRAALPKDLRAPPGATAEAILNTGQRTLVGLWAGPAWDIVLRALQSG